MLAYENGCPACSNKCSKIVPGFFNVRECKGCGGIYGHVGYKGDRVKLYNPVMQDDTPDTPLQYIDVTFLGSEGMERFHGWIDRNTRNIVQLG